MLGGDGEATERRAWTSLRGRVLSRRRFRIVFVVAVLALSAPIAAAFVDSGTEWTEARMEDRTVAPADGITVVTTDAYGGGRIAAYAPNGSTLYYNDSYDYYHDVDPSEVGETTVLYVATEDVGKRACYSEVKCRRSVVERLNLTTGEVTRLWSDVRPSRGSSAIHDVDYVGDGKLLVAEIAHPDGVYFVNVTTGTIEWNWRAEQNFSLESGGRYPEDWTHLNDVELLDDGRVMVSLRNQDQVVFLDPGYGVQSNWTLGVDDRHEVLFEAHNPDYVPESRGGPAVLVADSENNRVIEYHRERGEWVRTWVWQDAAMEWPRDADRLPNGNTLVTDSNGDRVLEVNRRGEVVWSMSFPGPYEAERLGTGDESAGGSSAKSLGLQSRTYDSPVSESADGETPIAKRVVYGFLRLLPPQVLHGLLFLFPAWMTPLSAISLVALLSVVAVWALFELQWRGYGVRVSTPVSLTRRTDFDESHARNPDED